MQWILWDPFKEQRVSRMLYGWWRVLSPVMEACLKSQPFDQHLLLACIAPRALLLECYHKLWFDPKGEFLAAKAASPVWELLTRKGLGLDDMPPEYSDCAVKPPFGFVRRTECHGLSPYDWKWALDFADRSLDMEKKQGKCGK